MPVGPTAPVCSERFTCHGVGWHTRSQNRQNTKLSFLLLQHTAASACQMQLSCVLCPTPYPATLKASWVK